MHFDKTYTAKKPKLLALKVPNQLIMNNVNPNNLHKRIHATKLPPIQVRDLTSQATTSL